MLFQLEQALDTMKGDFLSRKGRRDQLVDDKSKLEGSIQQIQVDLDVKEKSAELLRSSGDHARKQAKANLEIMVTNALKFVFKEDIEFKIKFEAKRGRPEAQFFIVNTYEGGVQVENDPKISRGGGLIDVVAITLRLALAESFGVQGPIILDEPAKHLSAEYIPAFADFLKQFSIEFDRQIIMVTHNNTLAECGDTTYQVVKINGVSQVQKVVKMGEE